MAIYAITLAFSNADILSRSISEFYKTRNEDLPLSAHFIVDQHYPLNYQTTRNAIEKLSKDYGLRIMDFGRNLGLHHGFNAALREINPNPSDIIIGYDCDSLPITRGWDMALVRAIESRRSDPQGEVVWASLANPRTLSDVFARGYDPVMADGYLRLFLTRTAVTNSVCAFRYRWLQQVGFLQEPRPFYGHLEATMWQKLGPGRRWAILPDFREAEDLRYLHDREYVIYKWRHSHLNDWPGDFAGFVAAGCPESGRTAPQSIP